MRYLRPVVIVAIIFSSVGAQPGLALDSSKKVDCHKDLKKARELIDDYWSFLIFKPGYVDLEETFRQLEPVAKGADTPEACAKVLARFMAKLGDGHSRLQYYPDLNYSSPLMVLRSQRERLSQVSGQRPQVHVYVIERDTTDEQLMTIPVGSEILSVDGVKTHDLYHDMVQYVAGSTSQWRDYICDRELLLGPAETEIELVYREPGGAKKDDRRYSAAPRQPKGHTERGKIAPRLDRGSLLQTTRWWLGLYPLHEFFARQRGTNSQAFRPGAGLRR